MCILVNVSVCVLAESSATSVHETMLRPALVRGFAGGRRGGDVRLEGPRERGTHPRIHHAGATARRAHVIPARPAKGNLAERQSLRARRKLPSIHDDMPENVDEHFAAPTNTVTQV